MSVTMVHEGAMFEDAKDGKVYEVIRFRRVENENPLLSELALLKLHGPECALPEVPTIDIYQAVSDGRWRKLTPQEAAAVE